MAKKQKDGVGPIIAIIVIVIVLALGGLYYLVNEIEHIRANGGAVAFVVQSN